MRQWATSREFSAICSLFYTLQNEVFEGDMFEIHLITSQFDEWLGRPLNFRKKVSFHLLSFNTHQYEILTPTLINRK